MNSTSRVLYFSRVIAFAFAAVAGSVDLGPLARAQDDVSGGRPVFSTSKKKPLPDTASDKQLQVIRRESNLVTTPVAVMDKSGQFIYGLVEKDFEILDNDVPQRISSFDTEMQPLAMVIVIQADSRIAPMLDQVHPLASMFSTLLVGANGYAAVIFFNDRVRVGQDFSNDSDLLAATFHEFTARGGGARLNDALARAVAMLAARPKAERRVIVAFSDGYDSGSDTGRDELVRRATSAEVAIYGLGFSPAKEILNKKPDVPRDSPLDNNGALPTPPGTIHTPTSSSNEHSTPIPAIPIMVATGEVIRSTLASNPLEFYAGYTGGVYYSHWSDKSLQPQLNKIASEIHSQYELAYVPDTGGQGAFHRIEVRVNRAGVKVRARAGYFAPVKTQ
jgi:VWFA-related protein